MHPTPNYDCKATDAACGASIGVQSPSVEIDRKAECHAPFWLVWNPRGQAPTFPHTSEQGALNEAERLARTRPGHQFFVLQPTHARFVDDMHRVTLHVSPTIDDDTPF